MEGTRREQNGIESINKRFVLILKYIRLVKTTKPSMSSAEMKERFLSKLEQASASDEHPSWRKSGFTEEAFHSFWELAWLEAAKSN